MNTTPEWYAAHAAPYVLDEWTVEEDRHGICWHVLVKRQYPTMLADVHDSHQPCTVPCTTVEVTVTATFDGHPLPRIGHDDPLGQVHRRGVHYEHSMDRTDMWFAFAGQMADQARVALWDGRDAAIAALQIEAHRVRKLRIAARRAMGSIAPDGQALSEVHWGDPL